MEKVILTVKGMSCGHCQKAVETAVGELPGVATVAVTLETGKVEINYDASEITLEEIKKTILEEEYEIV